MAYFLLQLQDTDKVSNVTTCCECNYVNIKLSPELECYESAEIPDDEMTLEMNGVFYVGGVYVQNFPEQSRVYYMPIIDV